ncbi:protocadherin Fat 4 [Trichonephila clavipes]|nr:protocadherin Fat 4 [Trichonephila clavipes]
MTLADCRRPLFTCRMIYQSSPAVVVPGRPPPTFLTVVPVVWNAFQARNDIFVDSELCSYTGDDPCMKNPCKNGGRCVFNMTSYKCVCRSGYVGKTCEIKDPCMKDPCKNGGTCVSNMTSYKCMCRSGYVGKTCEIKEDSCTKNPCQNGGSCKVNGTSFKCECKVPYFGEKCEKVHSYDFEDLFNSIDLYDIIKVLRHERLTENGEHWHIAIRYENRNNN